VDPRPSNKVEEEKTPEGSSKNPDGFFSFLGFDNPQNFEHRALQIDYE